MQENSWILNLNLWEFECFRLYHYNFFKLDTKQILKASWQAEVILSQKKSAFNLKGINNNVENESPPSNEQLIT